TTSPPPPAVSTTRGEVASARRSSARRRASFIAASTSAGSSRSPGWRPPRSSLTRRSGAPRPSIDGKSTPSASTNHSRPAATQRGLERSASASSRVLEGPIDETGEQVTEVDPGGARRLGKQAVLRHAGNRVHLERDHSLTRPQKIRARHSATAERLVCANGDVLRALRDVRGQLGWTDLLALAGVVFGAVVEEGALRLDLDHRQRLQLVGPDDRDRQLPPADPFLDEHPGLRTGR